MIDAETVRPYYDNFCTWMQFIHRETFVAFQMGTLDAQQLKPYVRDWAKNIT